MEICARNIQKVQVQKVKNIQIKIILRSIILAPLLKCVSNIVILPILISDHSPIFCNIIPITAHAKFRRWHFNDSLLYDATYMDQLRSGLTEFLESNTDHCSNP